MAENDWHIQETTRSMIQFGLEMLRYTFLANGASILAILTFLGDLRAKGGDIPDLRAPVAAFVTGVLLSGIAIFAAYISQFYLYRESMHRRAGKGIRAHLLWLYGTLGIVLAGIGSFAVGAFLAASRLT